MAIVLMSLIIPTHRLNIENPRLSVVEDRYLVAGGEALGVRLYMKKTLVEKYNPTKIGTLTFLDEKTNKFGVLGHSMINTDDLEPMNSQNGEIVKARIYSIEPGEKGNSGEIRGLSFESKYILGDIKSNTQFGVYGDMNIKELNKKKKAFLVASQDEIKIGKAYMLSTIQEDKIEEFEVEVLKVKKQRFAKAKSILIEVTDKKLLNKTGGIVKGMSGSPIIQNGKIIGAVTHVCVNDPTKGYGIFIEWMLKESDLLDENNQISQNNT